MLEPLRVAISPTSHEWLTFKRHIETRIEEARDRLEAPIDERAADLCRGAIAELRALIEEVEPRASTFPEMSEFARLY